MIFSVLQGGLEGFECPLLRAHVAGAHDAVAVEFVGLEGSGKKNQSQRAAALIAARL